MVQDWAVGLPQVLVTTTARSRLSEVSQSESIYGLERLMNITTSFRNQTRTWFLPDGLGSPLMTTDKYGSPTTFRAFTEWGAASNPAAPLVSPFGFTGELQGDSAIGGLVYLRARWYNPVDGTFLTRDPFAGRAEQPYSLHPYQCWLQQSGEQHRSAWRKL